MEQSKSALTPRNKETVEQLVKGEDELDHDQAKDFHSNAGTLLYHALDDPRIQYSASVIMTGMSQPRALDTAGLSRTLRYLKGTPTVA